MKIIQKIFTQKEQVKNGDKYIFNVEENSLYLIEIIASAKSWWQNLLKLKLGDDDLTVKIDNLEFPKLNNKRGLFDGEVAWNGNNLKGLNKTNVFIINLSEGNHVITFLTNKSPIAHSIKIYKTNNKINYVLKENNPAEDGDRRQWITIILVNLPLKNININAIVKSHPKQKDQDDIKLIIDSEIQLNENKKDKQHKYWYWSGKIQNGQEKEFNKNLNKIKGLHYIELWADKMPEIKSVNVITEGPKRIPTVDDPEWTGDFNNDTEQMILARAIWGEARNTSRKTRIAVAWSIKNRLGLRKAWDSYYHIILDDAQYSCFWEKPPKDSNLRALKNPLINLDDKIKWEETYEIAGKVISGETNDPTNGANHYYDESINTPYWATKNTFKIKIDTIFFHQL